MIAFRYPIISIIVRPFMNHKAAWGISRKFPARLPPKWFQNCGPRKWQQVIRRRNFETRCLSQFIVCRSSKIIRRANPVSSQQTHQFRRYLRLQPASLRLVSPSAYNKSITRVISRVANHPTFILGSTPTILIVQLSPPSCLQQTRSVSSYWSSCVYRLSAVSSACHDRNFEMNR